MRDRTSRLKNKASNKIGMGFQIRLTLVSKRMIANMETTPVEAMSSPYRRGRSGPASETVQTTAGARNEQIALAKQLRAFPQRISGNNASGPKRFMQVWENKTDTS